jgi:hypothetical protein
MTEDRDFYAEEKERDIVCWCAYCKEAIYEGDKEVKYKDEVYHRDCFVQMNLYKNGEILGYDSEE